MIIRVKSHKLFGQVACLYVITAVTYSNARCKQQHKRTIMSLTFIVNDYTKNCFLINYSINLISTLKAVVMLQVMQSGQRDYRKSNDF